MNSERYENRVFKDLKITEKQLKDVNSWNVHSTAVRLKTVKIIRNKFIDCQFNSCTGDQPPVKIFRDETFRVYELQSDRHSLG